MSKTLPLVSLRAATLGYNGVPVLHGVDLDFGAGDLIAMAGPNGAGKTTILRTILGFIPALAGMLIRNCALNQFGYVPQSSALDSTFPITAREVVAMGGFGRLKYYRGMPGREKRRLQDVLDQVGLAPLAGRSFFSLSGGQRQRILIARALMVVPQILVLDEPLSGVDPESQKAISELLLKLNRDEGKAIVFSSHDLRMVRSMTDKILRVDGGKVTWEEGMVAQHPW
jgi:manganese/iron transport system ATP-binding protein